MSPTGPRPNLARILATTAFAAFAGSAAAQPIVFTQWNFNSAPTGQVINNPAPSTGRGVAVPLGMTNNYTYSTSPPVTGSVVSCDVLASGVSGDTGNPNNCWRIRGSHNGTAGIGYALQAPQFTQGAEFDVSTVNYSGIVFTFDWFTTNQGVRNQQVQYSTDAGVTWTSIGSLGVAVPNAWINGVTIDFSSIPAVDDNPNFRVRMVTAYDPTYNGPGAPTYTGASGGRYNNASGNWRFDRVTFTGTPVRTIGPALVANVDPPAVCASGGTLTFTVNATGGANPPSTNLTVTADLSPLGLSATQNFFDDGTNGDAIAGDGIYTYVATVPGGRPVAPVSIGATVTDSEGRNASTSIPVAVGDCSQNAASRVVISQTFAGGGALGAIPAEDAPFNADYVEIYNRSGSPVNVNGWSVQYASGGSSGGFNDSGNQVILSGTIQPGQFYLVRMSDPVPGFNPLPTPDFSTVTGFGGMSRTAGRVALVRNATLLGTNFNDPSIEDFVGYGLADNFEGVAPTPAPVPSSNTAEIRKQGGTQDTNQNFNDFAGGTPNPRSRANGGFLAGFATQSDAAVCSGSPVTFFVNVLPGNGSTGIRVIADVSDITGTPGSTVELFDNGQNGDANQNDGIYSRTYTVPASAAQGNRSVTFNVTDLQGRSDASSASIAVGNCSNSSAPVVISQVYGGGGNDFSGFNGDFAEIFNRSNAPVDLTGWSFQSARISDQGFDNRICLLSGTINPGEYRLIITNALSATGAQLPAADFTPATLFGMESSFGRVALVSTTNLVGTDYTRSDVVDLVGYGSASQSFEGVSPTGTLSDILVAVRKQGGCQDNNQNAIDFDVVLAITPPHNSASATNLCPVTCAADFNGDTVLNSDDLSDFITGYFNLPSDPRTDFNHDGVINADDLGDFITSYFNGC